MFGIKKVGCLELAGPLNFFVQQRRQKKLSENIFHDFTDQIGPRSLQFLPLACRHHHIGELADEMNGRSLQIGGAVEVGQGQQRTATIDLQV